MAQEPRLARHEIALIKAMLAKKDMPKDRIQAYFSRPDRTVDCGRIHNIETGKIGAGVEAAADHELAAFLDSFGKTIPQEPSETRVPVTINGRTVARANAADAKGRPLPHWGGCIHLTATQIFVLSDDPDSFDSRYLGPAEPRDVLGTAIPVWVRATTAPPSCAGDLQHGSGLAVHLYSVNGRSDEERNQDQHGRQRRVDAEHRFAMTRDNVFPGSSPRTSRLWRSVKYEKVYLRAYDSVSDARASIGRYLDLYNRRRPHSSLDDMTPDQAYFGSQRMLPVRLAA